MTSIAYLNALHPQLSFHVHGDEENGESSSRGRIRDVERAGSDDGNEGHDEEDEEELMQETDAIQEEELEEAREEDQEYERSEKARSRRGSRIRDNDYALHRTSSPDGITDDIELGPVANGHDDVNKFPRTVTINEPVRGSLDKRSDTITSPAEGARRRHKYLPRANTFSSLSSFVSESWDKRHDSGHKGFWHTTIHWILGSKDAQAQQDLREGDPDYVPPKYRWTPILSGLLQPFSILLEIPGLTEHWYVRTIDNKPVVYQANPVILDVGLAISMACAVVANIALISRFLERRVWSSTIVTIVGLSIHDIINIIAVTIFGVVHRFDDGFTYSEAFWLCVCSTAASMFTNATLIYDLIKTKEFARSGSGLTPKQRSLVIIVMVFLVYLALGALCFNFLIPEIAFQNALYFTVVSIETIGFGDISPSTLGAKIFLFFYAPIGILNLAVTVGTARDTIVESWNTAYRRRRYEMIKRHRARKQQRAEEAIRRDAIEEQLTAIGAPLYVTARGGGVRGGARSRKLNVRALTKDQLQMAEDQALSQIASRQASASMPMTNGTNGSAAGDISASRDEKYQKALADARRLQDELTAQSLLSEEGYREFQDRMAKEERMENWVKFGSAMTLFIVFWVVGASVFSATEHDWTWFSGFYFCFVTFTTIGYGDISPQTPAGRAFFIIWAILGVATVTLLIAVVTEAYSRRYASATRRKGARRALDAIAASRTQTLEDEKQQGPIVHDKNQMENLPADLLAAVREWHQHVLAARQGAIEGNESEGMKQLVTRLMDEQGLSEGEKKELEADQESRAVMFWNGYERSVHKLVGLAESALKHHDARHRDRLALRQLAAPGLAGKETRRQLNALGDLSEAWSSQPDLKARTSLRRTSLERRPFSSETVRRMSR